MTTTPAPTSREAVERLWLDLLEKDDRTSPPEYPDMALITKDELGAALRVALEAAAKAVKQVSDGFLSEEYATPQPVGSIQERFACEQAIDAILSLIPKEPT
jgi:hypothetical protein